MPRQVSFLPKHLLNFRDFFNILAEMKRFLLKVNSLENGALALLLVGWLICILIAYPRGNFPVNDDWSYSIAVERFLETGKFRPLGFVSMPLFSQVLWGSIVSLISGYSFESLRISTIVISLAGLSATFFICRMQTRSLNASLIGSSLLAFNPLYFSLSTQFMTDVPFTVLITIAAFFLAKNLKEFTFQSLTLGILFSTAATLNRQIGIAVPIGFAVWHLTFNRYPSLKVRSIILSLLPFAIAALALVILEWWMNANGVVPALYSKQNSSIANIILNPSFSDVFRFFGYSLTALLYLGFFLTPYLIIILGSNCNSLRIKFSGFTVEPLFSLTVLIAFLAVPLSFIKEPFNKTMPILFGNILYKGGIGPVAMVNSDPRPIGWLQYLWSGVTFLSLAGAAILLILFAKQLIALLSYTKFRSSPCINFSHAEPASIFFFICTVIYLLPILFHGFYDRYLIPALPLLLGWLSGNYRSPAFASISLISKRASFGFLFAKVFIALFCLLSILMTRDFYVLQRARWTILDNLTVAQGVLPEQIDGGFEFNGLYSYNSDYQPRTGKSWWWVQDNKYIVSMAPVPGYKVEKVVNFSRLLPPQASKIYLLKRTFSK